MGAFFYLEPYAIASIASPITAFDHRWPPLSNNIWSLFLPKHEKFPLQFFFLL